jgi:DNA polymerase elongation subunit (family B)
VRGASGAEYAGTPPPHAQVAMARARADRRDVAEAGERIPFVIAHTRSSPVSKLIDSARRPEDLLFGGVGGRAALDLNPEHYILKRVLPPLDRVLKLVGVEV